MSEKFENKVVAITGAGKGLGRAYARYLAGLGASVVVNNRGHAGEEQSSADSVVREIVDAGGTAIAEVSSVEEPAAGEKLLTTAIDNFGRLDCLIANAGISENKTFRKQTVEGLREILEINLFGTINIVHPVFRYMCEQQSGNIIVSTSSAGLFGELGLPGYSTSKAALIGLMHSLSLEGEPKNVRVNAIAPYATTQMTSDHMPDELARNLRPESVAPVVAWLASGSANGEILIAGGDRVARAKMQTTLTTAVPDIDSYDWQRLQTASSELEFASAGAHFRKFISGIVTNEKDQSGK
jgi:NAD(P)-dependent dehydrogenase (short-subunit alcohol dehydrogenase family)